MISLKKINDISVIPLDIKTINPEKIKGYAMIPELYANIYMVAHKKSGKTTAIFNILKTCADKRTHLIFFGSTIYNDASYVSMFKYFKKQGNQITKFTSIIHEKNDQLKKILDELQLDKKDEDGGDEDDEPKEKIKYISVDDDEDDKPKRKPKIIAPEIIFIFDDLSKAMRVPSYSRLIKTNRHFLSKTITSSQNLKDISPDARENIDILIIFKGIKKDLLITIYDDFNIKLLFNTFLQIYKDATNKDHSFLFINTREHIYRRNFNYLYSINEIE